MKKRKLRGVLVLILGIFLIIFTACSFTADNIINEVMGPGESADSDSDDEIMPGTPRFLKYVLDCNTSGLVTPGALIQPGEGCDDWEINRYERPFNAVDQDEYYPDLDVQYADFGRDNAWFYLRIAVSDLRPASQYPEGVYGMELDLNQDNRGDILVIVQGPGQGGEGEWSVDGVQVWRDTNQDVGDSIPEQADPPYEGDGYDELVFNSGEGDDPSAAWSRAFFGGSAYVELAFKRSVISNSDTFTWWVWTDIGVRNPSGFDYHDSISHQDAGDANEGMTYFPTNLIYAVDNTCASLWGALPTNDPSLCINDPFVRPPDTDDSIDCPPMDFLVWRDWYVATNPCEPAPCSYSPCLLDHLYLLYLDKLDCDDPPPPVDLRFPPECPEMDFPDFVDWTYAMYPELYPTGDATLVIWYNTYLDILDCPEDDGPCIMTFTDWKAWWDSMNPGIDPSWGDYLALYDGYLLDPFCEDPVPCESECGDGVCECEEDPDTCPEDCEACIPTCGDGVCECDETYGICPEDCPACISACGDGECECDEDSETCPEDCPLCKTECGDGECKCEETDVSCPADCPPCESECGDGVCDCYETDVSCQDDCPPPTCDEDCVCEPDEGEYPASCPHDCPDHCGNGECDCGESWRTCPGDCPPPTCNDNCWCEPELGETATSCPTDCPEHCGNGDCDCGEDSSSCPRDCGPPPDPCDSVNCSSLVEKDCIAHACCNWVVGAPPNLGYCEKK